MHGCERVHSGRGVLHWTVDRDVERGHMEHSNRGWGRRITIRSVVYRRQRLHCSRIYQHERNRPAVCRTMGRHYLDGGSHAERCEWEAERCCVLLGQVLYRGRLVWLERSASRVVERSEVVRRIGPAT